MKVKRLLPDQRDSTNFYAMFREIAAAHISRTATGLTFPLAHVVPEQHAGPNLDGAALELEMSPQRRYELCADYDAEIDESLRRMESEDAGERPCPDYLTKVQHGQMDNYKRALLVRWMYFFTQRYNLADGTLHRAVAYVDRFLSPPLTITDDYELRLLGAVAVFAAAKYEDRYTTLKLTSAEVASYGLFAKDEVVAMETKVVAALDYRMGGPTAHTFVDHFTRSGGEDPRDDIVKSLARHLADLTLLDCRHLQFLPSTVTASAVFVARCTINQMRGFRWNDGLKELLACTRYATDDLRACIAAMYDMHELETWPGYQRMRINYQRHYSLLDRFEMTQHIFLAD
ncbi:putative cyclin-F2-1 [Triticum urartu]|uniref:putative cyclin-F2-1 n=1 Tax=Triticum urartu TaxID=4572 RepID=UPI0020439096|nr:putative cyclin-F2-1 [Triticum urartu]XP_048551857.1 putative cyclin-F2-1 [Triticum urartu]